MKENQMTKFKTPAGTLRSDVPPAFPSWRRRLACEFGRRPAASLETRTGTAALRRSAPPLPPRVICRRMRAAIRGSGVRFRNSGAPPRANGVAIQDNGVAICGKGLALNFSGVASWNNGVGIRGNGVALNFNGAAFRNNGAGIRFNGVALKFNGVTGKNNGFASKTAGFAKNCPVAAISAATASWQPAGVPFPNIGFPTESVPLRSDKEPCSPNRRGAIVMRRRAGDMASLVTKAK
jgi:hypothetical protein